jgi:hypothetical protein
MSRQEGLLPPRHLDRRSADGLRRVRRPKKLRGCIAASPNVPIKLSRSLSLLLAFRFLLRCHSILLSKFRNFRQHSWRSAYSVTMYSNCAHSCQEESELHGGKIKCPSNRREKESSMSARNASPNYRRMIAMFILAGLSRRGNARGCYDPQACGGPTAAESRRDAKSANCIQLMCHGLGWLDEVT